MCITYLNDLPKSHSPLKMSYSTEDTVMLREELSECTQRAADKAHVRGDSGGQGSFLLDIYFVPYAGKIST